MAQTNRDNRPFGLELIDQYQHGQLLLQLHGGKPSHRDQLERVLHLIEKPEHDDLPLPMASSLCNQEIISRCDQLICFAFHDSETLLTSCRSAEDMGKVVSLLFFD